MLREAAEAEKPVEVEEEPVVPKERVLKDHWLNRNAIGVYIGAIVSVNGYSVWDDYYYMPNIGIAYQRVLGNGRRLELVFSAFEVDEFACSGLSGTYQLLWRVSGGLHVYAGGGASLGAGEKSYINDGFDMGLIGVLGLEWKFNIPLTLTLDVRPWLHLTDFYDVSFVPTVDFGVNYTFGQPDPNKPKKQRNVVIH